MSPQNVFTSSRAIFRIALLAIVCLALSSGCNDTRQSVETIEDDAMESDDSGDTDSDAVVPANDVQLTDSEFDAAPDVAPDISDTAVIPDEIAEIDVSDPLECPPTLIVCESSSGASLTDGDRVGIVMVENPPTCRVNMAVESETPTSVSWSATSSGIGMDAQTLGLRSDYSVPTAVPGVLEVRANVELGELNCGSSFRFEIAPPDGLFAVISWDDGFEPDPVALSDTDIDTHLVRGEFCFGDRLNDLYFATDNAGLDWGTANETADNPRLTYDSRKSPGFEAAWLEQPDDSETVYLGVHGFDIRGLVGQTPVSVNYVVYVDGFVAAQGTAPVTKDEYAAVGALRDGRWLAATVEGRPDGQRCPVLNTPTP